MCKYSSRLTNLLKRCSRTETVLLNRVETDKILNWHNFKLVIIWSFQLPHTQLTLFRIILQFAEVCFLATLRERPKCSRVKAKKDENSRFYWVFDDFSLNFVELRQSAKDSIAYSAKLFVSWKAFKLAN